MKSGIAMGQGRDRITNTTDENQASLHGNDASRSMLTTAGRGVTTISDELNEKQIPVYLVQPDARLAAVLKAQLDHLGTQTRFFGSAETLLAEAESLSPGVIVCDQQLPGLSGQEFLEITSRLDRPFPFVLLLNAPQTAITVAAMKLGALSVLDVPHDRTLLIAAITEGTRKIREAANDPIQLPAPLKDGSRHVDLLSPREQQVIRLVYAGGTNKSIALQLDISVKTVEKHRGKAMKKMKVHSLAELIRLMDREA